MRPTFMGLETAKRGIMVNQKAIDIAEGRKVDPTFYSVIYGAAEDEDWTDPKVWKKARRWRLYQSRKER